MQSDNDSGDSMARFFQSMANTNHPMTHDDQHKLFSMLEEQTKKLERLELGMYGDEHNRIKGMMDRLIHVEKWITGANTKIAMVTGVFTAILFMLKMAWDYITVRK